MNTTRLLTFTIALGTTACGPCVPTSIFTGPDYPKTTPPEARVTIAMPTLAALTAADVELLERHLRSSAAWRIHEERGGRYAMQRKLVDGEWIDGSNGFHSDFDAKVVVQTRVLFGLGKEHGFGRERGQITRAKPGTAPVQLVLEKYMDQPGLTSYLIVQGGAGVTVEIHEQAHGNDRTFTKKMIADVEAELAAVLAAKTELTNKGYIASIAPEGSVRVGSKPTLAIEDGFQPGLYGAVAWINPGERSVCHVRAFYTGKPSPGDKVPPQLAASGAKEISTGRVRKATRVLVGYGPDPEVTFRYSAGFMITEGDWSHRYPARFELWCEGPSGSKKLLSAEHHVAGWQR